MTRRASKSATKARIRRINAGPPPMPPHLLAMQNIAMIGTLGVPLGSGLPAIYLAAARALIEAAQQLRREQVEAAAPTGGPRWTSPR